MQTVAHQRCFNHAVREAVARCPQCRQFFCRECVTEHDDRVICAACLKKLAQVPLTKRGGFAMVIRTAQFLFGFMLVWFFFHLIGESLLSLPSSFHEGTVWKSKTFDEE